MGGDYSPRVWRSSMGLAQLSGLAQPHGSGAKVEPAGLGSGAKVQSPATLLWGLTPATPPATEDFTLGPDPSNPSGNRRLYFGA